ncbi:MAG: ABC transporter permease, partial [Candidatus Baltobacteraceae bacterium]
RSRAFIIATLGGVLMMALIVEMPAFFERVYTNQTSTIVLAGTPEIRTKASALLARDFSIVAQVDRLPSHVTAAYLRTRGDASAAVALSFRGGRLHADVFARDSAGWNDVRLGQLAPLALELGAGVPLAKSRPLVNIERNIRDVDRKFSDAKSASRGRALAFGLVFAMYLSIVMAGQSVMASVAEEKTSRIAELLVATISPMNLLSGKTIAVAATTLLQVAFWAAAALALFPRASTALSMSSAGGADSLAQGPIDPGLLVAFVAFFILGFLQYSTIYAAAASLISRTEDLGSVSGPIILPALLAFFLAQYALVAPEAPAVVAFSFVPFVSPLLMFTRVAVANVPAWQLSLAFAIDIVAVVLCFVVAGRVYRIGMLLSGNLPSPAQIWAAIRT